MPRPSKNPKLSGSSAEKERFEVLLEEVHSQQKLTLEGIAELKERMDRLEFRVGRVEQQLDSYSSAILANSNELRRLQHDVQKLQHDIAKLSDRIEVHEKLHAT